MKKTRQKLGLTQEQIAKELNCSLRAIWKIENSEMSQSLAHRYHNYLSHKLFEKNALILSEALQNDGIDATVIFERSKMNGTYSYIVNTSYTNTVGYHQFTNSFFYMLPKDNSETNMFEMHLICLILNNKLKSL